ncbi:MAG TPA: hypothetical protein DCF68_04725 [Cyanothece sp. UBA12306]|nr:hypothetical protein [Cyanothece sp. UBA12306]
MRIYSVISLASLLSLGLAVFTPKEINAQISVGPNIRVSPRNCLNEGRDCQAERFRENTRYNRQIYFQTPEKILQHFHRERSQRACLERTVTSPPPAIPSNCDQLLPQIESLNQKSPVLGLQELQQRQIDNLYPNVPK